MKVMKKSVRVVSTFTVTGNHHRNLDHAEGLDAVWFCCWWWWFLNVPSDKELREKNHTRCDCGFRAVEMKYFSHTL